MSQAQGRLCKAFYRYVHKLHGPCNVCTYMCRMASNGRLMLRREPVRPCACVPRGPSGRGPSYIRPNGWPRLPPTLPPRVPTPAGTPTGGRTSRPRFWCTQKGTPGSYLTYVRGEASQLATYASDLTNPQFLLRFCETHKPQRRFGVGSVGLTCTHTRPRCAVAIWNGVQAEPQSSVNGSLRAGHERGLSSGDEVPCRKVPLEPLVQQDKLQRAGRVSH
jgi:hypothetical protein